MIPHVRFCLVLRHSEVLGTARRHLRPRTRLRNFLAPRITINLYVVTRFSLRFEDWMRRAYGQETERANWFAMRARLFKACVVASMQQQTVAPRRVFVLMDVGDVDLWHQHLSLPTPYVPVFVRAEESSGEVARRIAADRTKNVVISRLDSDDAIDRRYVEKITDAARDFWRLGTPKAYMVACDGYVTDLKQIQQIYFNCSPFISVYVRRYNGENIYDGEHTQILDRQPRMIETARWMQVIHGSNIANRLHKVSKFEPDDRRKLEVGRLKPIESAWPPGFPPDLPVRAKTARETWRLPTNGKSAVPAYVKPGPVGEPNDRRGGWIASDPFVPFPAPTLSRHDLLRELHQQIQPRTYLEIGVSEGQSLSLSRARSIAIDPEFRVTHPIHCDLDLVRAKSDAFFGQTDPLAHLEGVALEFAFIDGMHLSEFALRDFMNVESHMNRAGIVVFDDVLPRNALEAARNRLTSAWTGDVYKSLEVLERHRPDLLVLLVNTHPTGTAIVVGVDPSSNVLKEVYDEELPYLTSEDPQSPPEYFMTRSLAVEAKAVLQSEAWELLARARHCGDYSLVAAAKDALRAVPRIGVTTAER
jgi:hypothetical protein